MMSHLVVSIYDDESPLNYGVEVSRGIQRYVEVVELFLVLFCFFVTTGCRIILNVC